MQHNHLLYIVLCSVCTKKKIKWSKEVTNRIKAVKKTTFTWDLNLFPTYLTTKIIRMVD